MNEMGSNSNNLKAMESSSRVRSYEIILRIFGLLLTLVASILVGVDKETTIISFTIAPNLPPLHVPVTAKSHYFSALVYLLVANAIACSYAAGCLIYSMARRITRNNGKLVVIIFDMIITGLLFSANGAAAAVGVIGRYGNSHTHWNKVCNVFDGYCCQMTAALLLSLLGTFVFLLLVMLAVFNLHKKSTIT